MFKISDIAKQTKTATGQVAETIFGGAVEDFIRGRGEGLRNGEEGLEGAARTPAPLNTWIATSYAAALAGSTSYRPKLKFLFKIEFLFKPGVLDNLVSAGLITSAVKTSIERNEFTFMVKTVDRPKVDFEYEEDVNMYNFRTKVLKKIRHRELTVTFLDDTGNRVFNFFRIMMMIYSPIVRRQVDRDGGTSRPADSLADANGMFFGGVKKDKKDSAHRAAVDTDVGGALSAIRIKQIFVNPGSPSLRSAVREVTFDFMNPRVVSFDLDDLSHEASDANLLTMQFDYDWMEMVDVGVLQNNDSPSFTVRSPGALTAPSDISITRAGPLDSTGSVISSAVGGVLGNVAQKLTSDLVNKAVRSIPGGGRLASAIGARAGSLLGSAASGTINSLVDGVGQDIARAVRSPVIDSNKVPPAGTTAYSPSSGATGNINPGILE
jgi:hypothetical protein